MLVGHRWRYSYDMRQYYCDSLPFGGVESHQWCVGCGVVVSDKELYDSKYPVPKHYRDGYEEGVYLNMLARGKGCEPVEAGTYQEWLLQKKRNSMENRI